MPIQIASLRDRREDIPLLAEFLLRQHSKLLRTRTCKELSAEAANSLSQRDWLGNVRELSSAMKQWLMGCSIESCGALDAYGSRAVSLGALAAGNLLERIRQHKGSLGVLKREIVEMAERERIMAALAACGGNHTRAASMLGISYRTIVRKLAQLKLDGTMTSAS